MPKSFVDIVNLQHQTELIKEIHEVKTADDVRLIVSRKLPAQRQPKANPILFIHGFGQNRYSWHLSKRSMENYFVDKGYETFNAELRGHGLSRANHTPYPESFEEYLTYDIPAVIHYILECSGAKKIFICGHSLGGTLAYSLSQEEQPYLAGLISIGGPYFFGNGTHVLKMGSKLLKLLHDYSVLSKVKLPCSYVDYIGKAVQKLLFYFDYPYNLFPIRVWYPRSIERDILIERIDKGFDRTGFNILKILIHWAATGRFESLDGQIDYNRSLVYHEEPILIILGNADDAVPLASVLQGMDMAKSRDKTIKIFGPEEHQVNWGHCDLICGRHAPEEVWPYMCDWMDKRVSNDA